MDELQFLKDEISSAKFNKRIFYAKNALRYPELMSLEFFVDNYIPYITNYLFSEENVEEVLTEYSNTLIYFLKFLGKGENFQNYKGNKGTPVDTIKDMILDLYSKLGKNTVIRSAGSTGYGELLINSHLYLNLKNKFIIFLFLL